MNDHKMSERRACRLLSVPRSTVRYQVRGRADDETLVATVRDFAYRLPQYGYRHITARMRRAGHHVNHKRVERIWRQEGLQLPKRRVVKRRHGQGGDVKQRAQYPNHVWSYDFTEDRTTHGQRVRVLVVMDEFTRECLMIYVAKRISAKQVVNLLSWLFATRGVPQHIRSDNGPEFVAHHVQQWLTEQGSQALYITPGSPWENPFIERFIETMKHESLNRYLFDRVTDAQVLLDHFMEEYNHSRPHSSLDDLTPVEFRQQYHPSAILTPTGT